MNNFSGGSPPAASTVVPLIANTVFPCSRDDVVIKAENVDATAPAIALMRNMRERDYTSSDDFLNEYANHIKGLNSGN